MKRFVSYVVLLVLVLGVCIYPQAHSASKHNKELEEVLFGDQRTIGRPQEFKDKAKALEYASYLCIDQFNGYGKKKLSFLKGRKVPALPHSIDSINFSKNAQHRSYTHRGWDHSYTAEEEKIANCKVRKTILLNTVNHEFDFGILSNSLLGYDAKCESFAALIYYVHVLGDYIEDGENARGKEEYKIQDLMIPFAAREARNTDQTESVIAQLQKYLAILFSDQKSKKNYKDMIRKMTEINKKAYSLNPANGQRSKEELDEYFGCVDELMKILKAYIPGLLKEEEFFKKAFVL